MELRRYAHLHAQRKEEEGNNSHESDILPNPLANGQLKAHALSNED